MCAYPSKSQSTHENISGQHRIWPDSWSVVQDPALKNNFQCFLKESTEDKRFAVQHSPCTLQVCLWIPASPTNTLHPAMHIGIISLSRASVYCCDRQRALSRLAHRLCAMFIYKKNNWVWRNLLTARRDRGGEGKLLLGVSSSRGSEWLSGGARWSQQGAGSLQLNQRHCWEEATLL